jgi:hypothetical protein
VIDAVLLPPVTTSLGDNLNENAEIAVFPNPASDYLNVTVNVVDAEDLKVSIINTSGTVFSDFVMNSSTSESLDISYLAPGMYYLTISGNNSFQSTKFIVTR